MFDPEKHGPDPGADLHRFEPAVGTSLLVKPTLNGFVTCPVQRIVSRARRLGPKGHNGMICKVVHNKLVLLQIFTANGRQTLGLRRHVIGGKLGVPCCLLKDAIVVDALS